MADIGVKAIINERKIKNKLYGNPRLARFAPQQWHKLMRQYTPMRDGNLYRNVQYLDFAIKYTSPYSHYMYNGEIYGPNLAFDENWNPISSTPPWDNVAYWRSKKGQRKSPTGRKFNYLKDRSPYATDHWDLAAEKAGQKDKLYKAINAALRSGQI